MTFSDFATAHFFDLAQQHAGVFVLLAVEPEWVSSDVGQSGKVKLCDKAFLKIAKLPLGNLKAHTVDLVGHFQAFQ
jgi:hypothetical protein